MKNIFFRIVYSLFVVCAIFVLSLSLASIEDLKLALAQTTPTITVTPTQLPYEPPFTVHTQPATNIISDSATLNGILCSVELSTPARTAVYSEYGTTSGLYTERVFVAGARDESSTDSIDLVKVSIRIRGLQAATTYYYRIYTR